MTALVWDKVGTRRYESGCDRGVLYLPDGSAIAWNGLTSVDEDFSAIAVEENYLDGIKYLNRRIPGEYSGSLKAVTYPDEFLEFDGTVPFKSGLFATEQAVNDRFGLSYRTRIGNDENSNLGYKIHVLYNLTAVPDSRSFGTFTDKGYAEEFSWKLSGIPMVVPGMKPTVHIIIDSTKIQPGSISFFEDALYGTDTTPGTLLSPLDLMAIEQEVVIGDDYTGFITDFITEPV